MDAALARDDQEGIPPEDILARDWRNSERLTPGDKADPAATDECLVGKSISDASWAEVVKHVTDPAEQVEFIIAMGNWMMFSLLFPTCAYHWRKV